MGTASSGWSAVRARRARPQRSRSSRLDAPRACTRPSRARGEAHDFKHEGEPPAHDFRRRRDRAAHPRAGRPRAGPYATSAATTGRRRSVRASRGMSAPISSGSRGGLSRAARMRAKSPDRRSPMAATTGSAGVGSAVVAAPRPPASASARSTAARSNPPRLCDGREVGQRVLRRRGGGFALPPEPSLEGADVAGAQAAGDDSSAPAAITAATFTATRECAAPRRVRTRISAAPPALPKQSQATSTIDFAERLVASGSGV